MTLIIQTTAFFIVYAMAAVCLHKTFKMKWYDWVTAWAIGGMVITYGFYKNGWLF
jgi:hypothetical protein